MKKVNIIGFFILNLITNNLIGQEKDSTSIGHNYAFDKKSVFFYFGTAFVKNTTKNYGVELEIPFGNYISFGGGLSTTHLPHEYINSQYVKYNGYNLALKFHTAFKANRAFDFIPSINYAKINKIENAEGFGIGADVRLFPNSHVAFQFGTGFLLKKNAKQSIPFSLGLAIRP